MSETANPVALHEARAILEHQVRALLEEPGRAHELPPLLLWGPPGVGKSTVVRSVCQAHGIGFVDIRLAQREPVDLRGLPVPRDDHVDWLLSGEWPRDPESAGVILFDELTAADRALQVAAYELLLDRRLGELYRVPPRWYLCAAGNREEDGAAALGLSSALANRFCHLEIAPELEPWIAWAAQQGLHPEVIGFLRYRPGCFFDASGDLQRGWPTPRTWERVARQLSLAERTGLAATATARIVEGLVGPGAAAEFNGFREWSGRLQDAEAVLLGRAPLEVPERADQCYALCAGLVYHLWRGTPEERARRIAGFLEAGRQLPSDFATMALIDALTDAEGLDTERCTQLFSHPAFAAWSEVHGAALAKRLPGMAPSPDAASPEVAG